MKKFYLVLMFVVLIATVMVISCSNENEQRNEFVAQVESKEVEMVEKPRSEIIENFDPENVEYFWVQDWNTRAFWSSNQTSDGIMYDGWFVRGTKVDSLVYFLYHKDGRSLEKYFYLTNLTDDPRNSSWWQQNLFSIPKDESIGDNIYDVVKNLCCIEEENVESKAVVENIIQDIKKLGLLERENPRLFEIGIALVRYTNLYYKETPYYDGDLSYDQAARLLADFN